MRNSGGEMVPFSAFATGEWVYGSPKLSRYNGVPAMEIQGEPAPGYSTGDAMAEIEKLAQELPSGIGISWTGLSYEERLSGDQAPALYALSLIVVFLCLAALYESWSIPMAVMLVVPLGVIGACAAGDPGARSVQRRVLPGGSVDDDRPDGEERDLIVEFAKDLHEEGWASSRRRWRPAACVCARSS
ncbi:efflux RND transporter permease subunit [Halopseudomonas pachastrellae]|nr:efflux RND transporter permease subunit [Halopseudomonas pachastrellae]